MAPRRIQRRRTAGWRMPDGAIYVGRPTRYGNPYLVNRYQSTETAVECFRECAQRILQINPGWLTPLRGHDLVCWCPLDQQWCHADVLLKLANR